jgi:hypothetical protein
MRRPISFVSSVLALSFLAGTAHAHHFIPYAMDIQFQPNDPQHVVIAGLDFGLFSSQDGGQTWHLGCYEAARASSGSSRSPRASLLVTTTGAVITQDGFDSMRSGAGLCTFESTFTGGAVSPSLGAGLRRAEDGTLFGLTSTGIDDGIVTQLWRSDADGASFVPVGSTLQGPFAASSFVTAPSPLLVAGAPPVIYAGGVIVGGDPHEFAIARSTDLGATWNIGASPTPEYTDRMQIELLGAAPSNSFLLFARMYVPDSSVPESIWFSSDAGSSWNVLYPADGRFDGFAFSPDGRTLALGDSKAGLFHVDVESLANGDAPDVQRVFDQPVFAITWNTSGLYAGLNEFQARNLPQFASVGVSHDGGRTFAPFMNVCDVQAAACDASSKANECFDDFRTDIVVNSQRCPSEVGGGANGSGSTTGGGGASSSGGASSGGVSSSGGAPSSGGDSSGGESNGGESSGGSAASDDDLRVTSCAMSSPNENSRSSHIAFFMLAAAGALLISRRR